MRTAAPIFELLRQSVLGHADMGLVRAVAATYEPGAIIHAACWHGVENHLLLALRQLDSDLVPLQPLRAVYEHGTAVHLRAVADLSVTAPLLAADGPALIVKGPVLSGLYPAPDLRAYNDLDIIVPRARFVDAVEKLESGGCVLLDRNWRQLRREDRTQVHLLAPHRTAIDLHWHIVNRGVARRGLTVDMTSVFRRARTTNISNVSCLTTDPVDTALHVIVHAGVSGGARLSQLIDVRHATAVPDLDWDSFAFRARAWGVGEMAAIVLARVGRVLDVPDAARNSMVLGRHRSWGAVVRKVESRSRPELRGDNGLVARLTRAARPTPTGSMATALAWLGFQARAWTSRRLVRLRHTAEDPDRLRHEYFTAVSEPLPASTLQEGQT